MGEVGILKDIRFNIKITTNEYLTPDLMSSFGVNLYQNSIVSE